MDFIHDIADAVSIEPVTQSAGVDDSRAGTRVSWLYIALTILQFSYFCFKWVSKTHISEGTFRAHVSFAALEKGIYNSMYSY